MLISPRPPSFIHTFRHRHRILLLVTIPTTIFVLLLLHPSSHQTIKTYYTEHAIPLISRLQLLPADPSVPEAAAASGPANSTLGFGAVAVVSGSTTSERMRRLIQAANVTGLDLSVPEQPVRTDEDVRKFRSGELVGQGRSEEGKPMGKGSILAWMGHLDVLEWFLATDRETILILEDDVDWDIRLRAQQVPLAAAAIRSTLSDLSSHSSSSSSPSPPSNNPTYWGPTTDWDLLYLGHCGDYFTSPSAKAIVEKAQQSALASIPHVIYHDQSLPTKENLHAFTAAFLGSLGVPERTRLIHESVFPLCTFGYAVTRAAARKLVAEIAPPRAPPAGEARAYDVVILRACRAGRISEENGKNHNSNEKSLRCLTVNPELMHHRPGDSLIAGVDTGKDKQKKVFRPPVDVAADEVIARTGETANIECGFWDGRFNWEEEGGQKLGTLEYLKEEVGSKGRCLKEGREV